jgi:CDGSH-type Zn-finger protein
MSMGEAGGPRIRIVKDGPYLVDGALPVTRQEIVVDDAGESVAWAEVERFPQRASCALCRCGSSEAKPYCDGSHRMPPFDGTETAGRVPYVEAAAALEGPRLVLRDQLDLCAEARFCAAKGAVWHRIEQDDDDSRAVVVTEAQLCPSGRYTAVDAATGDALEPGLEPSIAVVEDPSQGIGGPLWVRGGVPVTSSDGSTYEVRNRVTLCRCGASKNKPFCDGTHVEVGFSDTE